MNSRGENWTVWLPVLERHPELRLIVSHLGLPPAEEQTPTETIVRQALRSALALAKFPEVRIKLSGFYALTKPGYGYPHQAAGPYVEVLLADFSPSLEWVSFPQTFGLFTDMPFLDSADVERIEGSNLLALLAEITD